MPQAKPFTWTVSFTIHPTWVSDGFSLCNDRALQMLAREVGFGGADELSARVLEAPTAASIAQMQGYTRGNKDRDTIVNDLKEGCPDAGKITSALNRAKRLLESVAFVSQPGDTDGALKAINEAMSLIQPRQGEPVEYDI